MCLKMKWSKSKLKIFIYFKLFCKNREKSEFEKKGLDPDVVEIRFKHY